MAGECLECSPVVLRERGSEPGSGEERGGNIINISRSLVKRIQEKSI